MVNPTNLCLTQKQMNKQSRYRPRTGSGTWSAVEHKSIQAIYLESADRSRPCKNSTTLPAFHGLPSSAVRVCGSSNLYFHFF